MHHHNIRSRSRGVVGLRSHPRASQSEISARSRIRTVENSSQTKFAELTFHALEILVDKTTVLFYFERALKELSSSEFTLVMQRFLKITRTHPLNYAMVLTSGIAPVGALLMMRESPGVRRSS
jgi:hypothetical protein